MVQCVCRAPRAGSSTPAHRGPSLRLPLLRVLDAVRAGGYEICCLCNWEDDGQDDPRADEVWGGPNGAYSLAQARRNFLRHLIMYDPAQPSTRIGGADSPVELDAKRTMISSFDAMPSAPDEATLENLWQDVFRAEAVLESETKRKVEAYEAKHNAGGSV